MSKTTISFHYCFNVDKMEYTKSSGNLHQEYSYKYNDLMCRFKVEPKTINELVKSNPEWKKGSLYSKEMFKFLNNNFSKYPCWS